MNGGCTARRWRACSGASSTTTSIWIDGFRSTRVIRSWSPLGRGVRNTEWFHMLNADVISMPDKWEYPWYAAWDLAFHTIALSLVDFDFAKEQLLLMLRGLYAHPNGQIPAYEWNFGDVNPRCTPGPRSSSTKWSGPSAGRTCGSWNDRFRG